MTNDINLGRYNSEFNHVGQMSDSSSAFPNHFAESCHRGEIRKLCSAVTNHPVEFLQTTGAAVVVAAIGAVAVVVAFKYWPVIACVGCGAMLLGAISGNKKIFGAGLGMVMAPLGTAAGTALLIRSLYTGFIKNYGESPKTETTESTPRNSDTETTESTPGNSDTDTTESGASRIDRDKLQSDLVGTLTGLSLKQMKNRNNQSLIEKRIEKLSKEELYNFLIAMQGKELQRHSLAGYCGTPIVKNFLSLPPEDRKEILTKENEKAYKGLYEALFWGTKLSIGDKPAFYSLTNPELYKLIVSTNECSSANKDLPSWIATYLKNLSEQDINTLKSVHESSVKNGIKTLFTLLEQRFDQYKSEPVYVQGLLECLGFAQMKSENFIRPLTPDFRKLSNAPRPAQTSKKSPL